MKSFDRTEYSRQSEVKGQSALLLPPVLFSYIETLAYLTRSADECLYRVENQVITKLLCMKGQLVLISIEEEEDSGAIRVNLLNGPYDESITQCAADAVWEWFDLNRDLSPFYAMAEGDELLAQPVKQLHGLRIVGIDDLFEALCWGVIGQQINLSFAYTLKKRFVESFGQHVNWEGHTYWLFPTPAIIADLAPADLTALKLTGRKAEYIIGIAKLMAYGELSKEKLLQLPDWKAAEKELTRIRGVGPWTAHYVLMRCLRETAAFPIEDVGLHLAIKQLLGLNQKPSIPFIRELSAGWKGWESYATFYLWRTL